MKRNDYSASEEILNKCNFIRRVNNKTLFQEKVDFYKIFKN